MNTNRIKAIETGLISDILIVWDSVYEHSSICICSKKLNDNQALSLFNFSTRKYKIIKRELGLTQKEVEQVREWSGINAYLLDYSKNHWIKTEDFQALMFKYGDNPSEEQMKLQKYFTKVLSILHP